MANTYQDFTLADPYQVQQADLDRRQKMAEILQQQAFEPIQAGGYNGIQAPISPLQGLAKMLQAYVANKNQKDIRTEQMALGEKYRADQSGDVQNLVKALAAREATPASQENINPIEAGQGADQQTTMTIPAVAGKAAGVLDPSMIGQFKTPAMQNQALSMYMSQLAPKAPLILKQGDIAFNAGTGKEMFRAPDKAEYSQPVREIGEDGKPITVAYDKNGNRKVIAGGGPLAVSSDTKARLDQERSISDRAFNGLSANQKQQLANEAKRIGISGAELFYNTGMGAGGATAPAMPTNPPTMPANAGGGMPTAPTGAPRGASVANALPPKLQNQMQVKNLENQQEAAQNYPQIAQQANNLTSTIDQMIGNTAKGIKEHAGLKSVVGQAIPFEYTPFQGGTPGADFKALYDQVKGGAFLQAVQLMKGSGALSEIEGTKATAALTSASTAQSPEAFRKSMAAFRDAINSGLANSAAKAGNVRSYNPATGRIE